MKEKWINNKKRRSNFQSIIPFGSLALAVIIGLGAITYTASGQTRENIRSGQIRFFDPFKLTTIYLNESQSGMNPIVSNTQETTSPVLATETNQATTIPNGLITQSPIIPQRRPIRSPYRPPWVPGPPPWPPGPPPWPPGPPTYD